MRHEIEFGSPAWRRHRELSSSRYLAYILLIAMGFAGGLLQIVGAF